MGFTLIELLVVLAVIALLGSLIAPRYLERVEDAREIVLRQNLFGMRMALDQFYRDRGQYPDSLDELVSKRYIRELPLDPITQKTDTWIIIMPQSKPAIAGISSSSNEEPTASQAPLNTVTNGIFDVKSGATGKAKDGSSYASW